MAAGGAMLLAAEVNAGIEVFRLLEPEVQKGFVALFHLFHHKQQQITAAQFLAEAATELQQRQAQAAQPKAKPDVSSTSLDPDNPNVPQT